MLKRFPTGIACNWRQHRSFNERDLLSVKGLQTSTDYRTLESTNRLYSSADRGRYDLHRFERLEHYPLTRTSRLDVQHRNNLNRTSGQQQQHVGGLSDNLGTLTVQSTRRAPTLCATKEYSASNTSSSRSPLQTHPQIIVGEQLTRATELSALCNKNLNATIMTMNEASRLNNIEAGVGDYVVPVVDIITSAQDARHLTERRIKKTVRFGGSDDSPLVVSGANNLLPPVTTILPSTAVDVAAANILTSAKLSAKNTANLSQSDTERQWSQDSITKDSGFETSSNFTSSEDSNRGDPTKVEFIQI